MQCTLDFSSWLLMWHLLPRSTAVEHVRPLSPFVTVLRFESWVSDPVLLLNHTLKALTSSCNRPPGNWSSLQNHVDAYFPLTIDY
jgi:hypothetical protein